MGEGAALGMMAAGGAAKAYSTYQAGSYNEDRLRQSAALERVRGDQELQVAANQEGVVDARTTLATKSERANQAGQGVVVGAGTAGAQLASTEAVGEMDKLMIQINANRRAWGHQVTAAVDESEGEFAYRSGQSNALGGLLNTGASMEMASSRDRSGNSTAPTKPAPTKPAPTTDHGPWGDDTY